MAGKNEGVTFRVREKRNMIAENVERRTSLGRPERAGFRWRGSEKVEVIASMLARELLKYEILLIKSRRVSRRG